MASLKEQKEAFVTGHSGTTPIEILLVCLSAPLGILLFNQIQCTLTKPATDTSTSKCAMSKVTLVIIESLVLLLPMAICQTSLLYPWGVAVLVAEGIMAFGLRIWGGAKTSRGSSNDNINDSKLTFLSSYRSTVSYLTFVAILAVDFDVFPRRFAKTETVGYGLMDVGAGSFIVSAGLVSGYARKATSLAAAAPTANTDRQSSFWGTMRPVLVRSIPLIIMGLVRLVTTKGLEYQEHVSEYGIHWNFFFTLVCVSILSAAYRHLFPGPSSSCTSSVQLGSCSLILPWVVLLSYQIALSSYGVQLYIQDAARQCDENGGAWICNLFAADREGILGCIGYLCMFLISEDIARYCLWRPCKEPSERGIRMLILTSFLWTIHWVLSSNFDVSRRSTNATFVLWCLAHNITILLFIWIAFYITNGTKSPSPIFNAVNSHGLLVFILANLMTGLVNLSINTLAVNDSQALGIIFIYLFAVGFVSLAIEWALKRQVQKRERKFK